MSEEVITVKKKHYWWKYLLWFLFGFLFAIGGLVGGVFYAGTQLKAEQLLGMFGVDSSEYLTEEYEGKSIYDIVVELASGEITFNSLGDIRKITPYVDTLVDELNTTLNDYLGFTLDKTVLYSTNFTEIGDVFYDSAMNGITISFILDVNEGSEKILKFLAYNEDSNGNIDYNSPRSLNDLTQNMENILNEAELGDVIDYNPDDILAKFADFKIMNLSNEFMTVTLADILEINSTSEKVLQYIAFNKNADGTLNYNNPRSLDNLINGPGIEGIINSATLGDLIDVGESGILFNLRNFHLDELATKVEELPLNQIIDIPEDAYPALKYLANVPVNGTAINNALESATLGDLIEISEDSILYELKDKKINEIDDGIKELTLKSVIEINDASPYVLKSLADVQIGDLSTALSDFTIDKFIEINSDSPWILKSLQNKGTKLDNIGEVISTLTLAEMIEDTSSSKILQTLSGETLDTIPTRINELTLEEAIDIPEDAPAVLKALATSNINNLSESLNSLTMESILGIDETSPKILKSIKNATLSNISEVIDNLTIGDVMDNPDNNKLLQTLIDKNAKINDLGSTLNTLTLGEMIDINESSSKILKALENSTLSSLPTDINELTIGDVMGVANNKFLSAIDSNTKINEVGTALINAKFTVVFHDEIYDESGNVKTTWKYLLKDETGTINTNYTLGGDYNNSGTSDMNKMIENMKRNISDATLRELSEDGFINTTGVDLEKELGGVKLGDMTIQALLTAIQVFL